MVENIFIFQQISNLFIFISAKNYIKSFNKTQIIFPWKSKK